MSTPEQVLSFWFGPNMASPSGASQKRWWVKDPSYDQLLRDTFLSTWQAATGRELEHWAASPTGRLALILVLDQMSRNLWRGSPKTWAQDSHALSHTLEALSLGEDADLPLHARLFLYMPLEHSEDLEMQEKSVAYFTALHAQYGEPVAQLLEFARRHEVIVRRFGRFPHRNKILGRESTPEELTFLTQPGSSF